MEHIFQIESKHMAFDISEFLDASRDKTNWLICSYLRQAWVGTSECSLISKISLSMVSTKSYT